MDYTNNHEIMPNVIAIIQSRIESKRFPGKSIKNLAGLSILEHVIHRAKLIENVSDVVVATVDNENNNVISDVASQAGAKVFKGSESNVLERYYLSAKAHSADYVVRITGDNPFTDVDYASMAVEISVASRADLVSILNIPLGTAVEVIKFKALEIAYKESSTSYQHEHVTPYIKEHPELFTVQRHPINLKLPFENIRLTVDTQADYEFASIIYDSLFDCSVFETEKYVPISLQEIVSFLKENPDLIKINCRIEQRPMTHSENE